MDDRLPARPMIEEQDIAEAMLYLCAQSGRYITGTTLTVDAGYTAKVV